MFNPEIAYNLPGLPGNVNIANSDFLDLLISVRTELAEIKGYSHALPNPLLLLSPAIIKESLASSEIENINTTLEEVLQNELFPEFERRLPDKEVLRYRDAVIFAYEEMKRLPLSNRLILGIHRILAPGDSDSFRKIQNRIENTLTRQVIYTPPAANKIPELISNWEKFVNETGTNYDPVLKAIIAHYQFEAIHPFGDGNGRTGRILLLMQLIKDNVLNLPVLYISGYINKNRTRYYETLVNVTRENNWKDFAVFMLNAIYLQAVETKSLIFKISELNNELKAKVRADNSKIYSSDLIDALFSNPIITPGKLGKLMDIHYTTASRYLTDLARTGVLKESRTGKYHIFVNHELMSIINR